MGTELIASQMDEGGAKDVVSGAGQTLSYAGTGAMIGSVIPGIGTAVGAIVGGGIGLIKSFFEAEDNRKARDEAARKQKETQDKRTSELLEQFATRPVQLNVGGKTILDFNTAQNLYGTSENSFA
jgi:phage tail tape-measure protein